MGKIIAVINQKGGSAKTTCTCALGAGLYNEGRKVLLLDLDVQKNLTSHLGVRAESANVGMFDLMTHDLVEPENVIFDRQGLHIIPATNQSLKLEDAIRNEPGRDSILRDRLHDVKNKYDYILLDCPPSLGLISSNALTAADFVLIPVTCQFFALEGVAALIKTIKVIKQRLNQNLKIIGFLLSHFDARRALDLNVRKTLFNRFQKFVFATPIRENTALACAPVSGQTIFEYEPACIGAEDYKTLVRDFLRRIENGKA